MSNMPVSDDSDAETRSDEMAHDEPEFGQRDVRNLLVKSFFVVTLCYTLFIFGILIVGSIVFSDAFFAMGNLEPAAFEELLEKDSAKLFPRARYLPFIALTTLFCTALGWLIVRLAPFSQMVHAVFLVLLVAATSFIIATGDKTVAELQTLAIALVGLGPIGMVIGAKFSLSRLQEREREAANFDARLGDQDER